jgi:hypothetical protein
LNRESEQKDKGKAKGERQIDATLQRPTLNPKGPEQAIEKPLIRPCRRRRLASEVEGRRFELDFFWAFGLERFQCLAALAKKSDGRRCV